MAFSDYPFTQGSTSFVPHNIVLEYYQDVCKHFNLRQLIQFNTVVTLVRPKSIKTDVNNDEKLVWEVTVQNRLNGRKDTREFDAVIVCVGNYRIPKIPKIAGADKFQGRAIHSMNYRTPELYRDRRVVCIGANVSGMEIALDLHQAKVQNVMLSSREPRISQSAKDNTLQHKKIQHTAHIPPEIIAIKEVIRIEQSTIHTLDGNSYPVDDVIYCTGYEHHYGFLHPDCQVETADFNCPVLWQNLIHPKFPSMCFVGLLKKIVPGTLSEIQIRFFQKVLEGKVQLPTESELDSDHEFWLQRARKKGTSEANFHFIGADAWPYYDRLAAIGHFESYPKVVRLMFEQNEKNRLAGGLAFRNFNYTVMSDTTFTMAVVCQSPDINLDIKKINL